MICQLKVKLQERMKKKNNLNQEPKRWSIKILFPI